MSSMQLLVFCGIAILQVGSPGPSTVFVVNNAVTLGWGRAVAILTGDLLAVGLLGVLSLLGVDAVLTANPTLFTALKIAGALYLIWLGIAQWRNAATQRLQSSADQAMLTEAGPYQRAAPLLWWKSFFIGISNPKAILFFSSLLPQFIDPAQAGRQRLLGLIALFLLVKLVVLGAYAMLATRAMHFLQGGNAKWGKRLTGIVLMSFGAAIALSALR